MDKMSPVYLLLIPWLVYLSHWPLQPIDQATAITLVPLIHKIYVDACRGLKAWLDYREGQRAVRDAIEMSRKSS